MLWEKGWSKPPQLTVNSWLGHWTCEIISVGTKYFLECFFIKQCIMLDDLKLGLM